MKRIISILALVICSLLISGCEETSNFDPDFEVALTTSYSTDKRTDIFFLNKDFDIVCKKEGLKYAEFGYPAGETAVSGGKFYAAPGGLQGRYDENKLVEIDLETGQIKESQTKDELEGPTSVSCDDEYISICANLNGKSYVGVCKKGETEFSTKEFSMEQGTVMDVYSHKGKVLCVTDTKVCYVLDADSLKTERKIKMQGEVDNFYGYEDTVYFSEDASEVVSDEKTIPKCFIGEYNVKTGIFKEHAMESKVCITSVKRWNDYLLCIDSNDHDEEGSQKYGRLIIADPDCNIIKTVPIKASVRQSIMNDDKLYLLQDKGDEDFYLTKYIIKTDGSVEKVKDKKVNDVVNDTLGLSFFVNKQHTDN